MAKEKKIGINYYLNQRLKALNAEGTRFPIYAVVTYDRKTTHLPLPIHYNISGLTESEFSKIFESKTANNGAKNVINAENELRKILRYEIEVLGGKFILKGFANRITIYEGLIRSNLEKVIQAEIKMFLENYLIVKDYKALFSLNLHLIDLIDEIEEVYLPSFFSKITDDLRIFIYTYLCYLSFELNSNTEFTFIHWIAKGYKEKFYTFLKKSDHTHLDSFKSLELNIDLLKKYIDMFEDVSKNINRVVATIDRIMLAKIAS